MKRAFLIHGLRGTPDNHWFPWLLKELKSRNFQGESLKMPNPGHPVCSDWVAEIGKAVGEPTAEDFFVGHSLGCIAIVRWLEHLPAGSKIGGTIFVAGFSGRIDVGGTETFWKDPVDFEKVKATASPGKFITIFSDDDDVVPLSKGLEFQQNLDAVLVLEKNKGHFCKDDGVTELPSVLESLISLMDKLDN